MKHAAINRARQLLPTCGAIEAARIMRTEGLTCKDQEIRSLRRAMVAAGDALDLSVDARSHDARRELPTAIADGSRELLRAQLRTGQHGIHSIANFRAACAGVGIAL